MCERDDSRRRARGGLSRRQLVEATVAAGAGLALTAPSRGLAATEAPAAPGPAACADSRQDILDVILLAERVATTFYYTGLTTGAIVAPALPASGGGTGRTGTARPGALKHLAYVEQALTEEQRHTQVWRDAGAGSRYGAFYFPAATFTRLGYTGQHGVFLGVLDYVETVLVGTYLAAIGRLGALGHTDLALMAVQILQTECTHRVLGRAIAGDNPADNVTLEVAAVPCVGDAAVALRPFVTGRGFQGGATASIPLPTEAHVARVTRLGRR